MSALSLIKELGLTGAQFNALSSLAESELSANAIIAQLSGTEAAIQRSKGLQVIKALRGITSTRPYVASVGVNKNLNPDNLPYAATDQLRNYSYRLVLTVTTDTDPTPQNIYRNVKSNDLLTKQQAIDEFLEQFNDGSDGYQYDVISAQVQQVTKKPGT